MNTREHELDTLFIYLIVNFINHNMNASIKVAILMIFDEYSKYLLIPTIKKNPRLPEKPFKTLFQPHWWLQNHVPLQ